MRVVSIQEALSLEDGEAIPSIKGRCTFVSDRYFGNKEGKDWSFQNLKISDSNQTITVKLKDRDAIPKNWKGKTVYIVSKKGDKGMTGIKAKDDEYNGKKERIVWVTPSATVALTDPDAQGEAAAEPAQEVAPRQTAPAQASAPAQPQQAKANGHTNGNGNGKEGDPSKFLAKKAQGYLRCLDAAHWVSVEHEKKHGQPLTPEHFQALTASLFISLDRAHLT